MLDRIMKQDGIHDDRDADLTSVRRSPDREQG